MINNNNKIDLRQKLIDQQIERDLIREITTKGEKLGFSWFKYKDEYYQIYNNQIKYAKQKFLKIDTRNGWYILDMINMSAVLLYIDGFEKILSGVDVNDIVIYPDKYFIFKTRDKSITELWRQDAQIAIADNIYRLTEKLWCFCSNGIYYLSNLVPNTAIPVGRYPLLYDPNRGILFYQDLDNKIPVDVSYLMSRLNDNN